MKRREFSSQDRDTEESPPEQRIAEGSETKTKEIDYNPEFRELIRRFPGVVKAFREIDQASRDFEQGLGRDHFKNVFEGEGFRIERVPIGP